MLQALEEVNAAKLINELENVSVRVDMSEDGPIERLRALKSADETVERWLAEAVGEARQSGLSWAAIGEALGVSRQAAWQLYNAELRSGVDRARRRSDLTEEEAASAAAEELSALRQAN